MTSTPKPMPKGQYSLEDLVRFAESRGGACLSSEFRGMAQMHRWRCGREHEFEASPRLLMHGGYWCPQCLPSLDGEPVWDYDALVEIDPLLRRFYRAG